MRFGTFTLLCCIELLLLNIAVAQDYGTGAFQDDESINAPTLPQTPSSQASAQQNTGDVSVMVKADGKPAAGAQVRLSCYGAGGDLRITDSFGVAVFHYVPVGQCQVIVTSGSNSDTKVVDVVKEQIKTVEFNFQNSNQVTGQITADDTQENSGRPSILSFFFWLGSVVVALFLGFISYKFIRKAIKKGQKTELPQVAPIQTAPSAAPQIAVAQNQISDPIKEEVKKEELSERTKDLLKILDDKEKQIVRFLLANDKLCSQAKIFYGTGIKRTTLHRIIDALAAKKILQVEKRAKARYVSLTDWFLGKDTANTDGASSS